METFCIAPLVSYAVIHLCRALLYQFAWARQKPLTCNTCMAFWVGCTFAWSFGSLMPTALAQAGATLLLLTLHDWLKGGEAWSPPE